MATLEPQNEAERHRDGTSSETGRLPGTLIRGGQLVVGTALVDYGRRQRSSRGTAATVGGGALIFSALGGMSRVKRALTDRTDGERATEPERRETAVRRSITVDGTPESLYEQWRDPETFAEIMGHFAEVTPVDEGRFRWTVHGPYGRDIGWETSVVVDEPGEICRWETPTDAVLPNEGAVRFEEAPGDRGTVVTLSVVFEPPGGTLGSAALEQFDIVPKKLVGVALDRFKSLVESGEVPTLDRNPSGRGSGDTV
ncbi:SRPBCC family protein [Haloarcula laminariae]|uniref:SRPBCC family protein n=1 Tax=Haloarcula laminariae TaxID=2961577 RepID=UPI002406C847|nr:SRPBCC family protein [Halomicroarcula sp. FL173]